MSEAWRNHTGASSRQHHHGKLVPMDRPEGELPIWAAALAGVALITVATLIIVAFTGA